ncbi:MAG TPA: hypothetical protein VJ728_18165 [Candidatus Binataceae bacterium]|nr:hypothetical protein [Candidatus Binataceae bacterium]
MGRKIISLAALMVLLILPVQGRPESSPKSSNSTIHANPEPPIQSGIYGFSGGKVPGADFPEGVVGECIWVFDQANKNQVAKGECTERNPGKFRVVLKPGHYVVHGPGGNKPIEVKAGQWIDIESLTLLPAGP